MILSEAIEKAEANQHLIGTKDDFGVIKHVAPLPDNKNMRDEFWKAYKIKMGISQQQEQQVNYNIFDYNLKSKVYKIYDSTDGELSNYVLLD